MTPFSWCFILLLLSFAATPTWGQSQIFVLDALYSMYKILRFFRLSSHTSSSLISKFVNTFENKLLCNPVSNGRSQTFIKTMKLYFYYGPNTTNSYAVPLSKASSLLHHERWRKDLPVAFYVYGWHNSPTTELTMKIVKGYYANGQRNLVIGDWGQASNAEYGEATTMVPRVGAAMAGAVQALLDAGAVQGEFVGHSLGAHVVSYIARNLKEKPHFVAGLDPAGPFFSPTMYKCQQGLSSTDAEHVVVLHADWNRMGVNEILGHVDFMPNDGHGLQPGCPIYDRKMGASCSHDRAALLWEAAIRSNGSILGRKCASWSEFESGMCASNSVLSLTEVTEDYGLFYLTTNTHVPFGKGLDGV